MCNKAKKYNQKKMKDWATFFSSRDGNVIFETINNIKKQFQQQSNKKDQEEYPGDHLH